MPTPEEPSPQKDTDTKDIEKALNSIKKAINNKEITVGDGIRIGIGIAIVSLVIGILCLALWEIIESGY